MGFQGIKSIVILCLNNKGNILKHLPLWSQGRELDWVPSFEDFFGLNYVLVLLVC